MFPPGFSNRDGDPLPLIVRSSAGAFTYATSDLACVVDRVERVGAEVLVYVVGAEQAQHLAMVFAVSEMAGWLQLPVEAVHVPFGNVLGTDGKMLRSRSGDPWASVRSSTRRSSAGSPPSRPRTRSYPMRCGNRSATPSASGR